MGRSRPSCALNDRFPLWINVQTVADEGRVDASISYGVQAKMSTFVFRKLINFSRSASTMEDPTRKNRLSSSSLIGTVTRSSTGPQLSLQSGPKRPPKLALREISGLASICLKFERLRHSTSLRRPGHHTNLLSVRWCQ